MGHLPVMDLTGVYHPLGHGGFGCRSLEGSVFLLPYSLYSILKLAAALVAVTVAAATHAYVLAALVVVVVVVVVHAFDVDTVVTSLK